MGAEAQYWNENPTCPDCATPGEPNPNLYAYLCIPISFTLSFSGAVLPLLDRVFPRLKFTEWIVFRMLIGMAGGIIVSVALTHSFPDGSNDLEYAIQQDAIPDFAWAGLCALLGLLITMGVEVLISLYLKASAHCYHSHHLDEEKQLLCNEEPCDTLQEGKALAGRELIVYLGDSIVLLVGLCFHSFFVGVNQGLQGDDVTFFVAVTAHQFFEGLALGVKNCQVQFSHSLLVILMFDFIFAMATPLGVGVGLAIKATVGSGVLFDIISGVSNSLSAGVLIWLGCIHLIHEELG